MPNCPWPRIEPRVLVVQDVPPHPDRGEPGEAPRDRPERGTRTPGDREQRERRQREHRRELHPEPDPDCHPGEHLLDSGIPEKKAGSDDRERRGDEVVLGRGRLERR